MIKQLSSLKTFSVFGLIFNFLSIIMAPAMLTSSQKVAARGPIGPERFQIYYLLPLVIGVITNLLIYLLIRTYFKKHILNKPLLSTILIIHTVLFWVMFLLFLDSRNETALMIIFANLGIILPNLFLTNISTLISIYKKSEIETQLTRSRKEDFR
ncbi:hypothetical protein LNTAR_13047 [Lentisphaera araneosa HTCC2155]|uniref:Uncharacterized protein n=1 Tax=Lentisphaera araneosa HTCC2155 TaxID=313628 RepID=A6DRK8_9BACT|nr:hypothetical protein [Lentisphaera araneosa]EDM25677.1 hypothetical protein LNTAR_13047 [Lentisphaera araneosa HTCC2155]